MIRDEDNQVNDVFQYFDNESKSWVEAQMISTEEIVAVLENINDSYRD